MESYLADRHPYTVDRKVSSSITQVMHGVPQGSILVPFFLLILINDIT